MFFIVYIVGCINRSTVHHGSMAGQSAKKEAERLGLPSEDLSEQAESDRFIRDVGDAFPSGKILGISWYFWCILVYSEWEVF